MKRSIIDDELLDGPDSAVTFPSTTETTKSTEEMSKELHDWLKREEDCWHVWVSTYSRSGMVCQACPCGESFIYNSEGWIAAEPTMNFFNPKDQAAINFFWLWDRMKGEENYTVRCRYLEKVGRWRVELSCTELAKALYEFLQDEDSNEK